MFRVRWGCIAAAVFVGALAIALLTPSLRSPPSLQVGMTCEEVREGLGCRDEWDQCRWVNPWLAYYEPPPDWIGNACVVEVRYDDNKRVCKWEVMDGPRRSPVWL